MTKLTYQQKLAALSYRFYQAGPWTPKAGDFYTTSRADLELYQVVSVENGVVRTRYTEGTDAISEWPEAGFLTEGFGPRRVFVPEWVICAPPAPPSLSVGDVAEPDGWICEDEFTLESEQRDEWVEEGLSPKPFYFAPPALTKLEDQP